MPHNYDFFGEKKNGYANFAYDSMSMLLQAIENLADQGITPCTTRLCRTDRKRAGETKEEESGGDERGRERRRKEENRGGGREEKRKREKRW
eukprot:1342556-Amorphochlora_amoeboformis.AAC.1